jgi:D-alanine-D-alanine ligase
VQRKSNPEKDKPPQKGRPGRSGNTCLGPVSNLEAHVRPDWWRAIFNATYLKTDGDVVDDINITRSEVDLLISILQASPDSALLDLCCGQGRHCLELARRGFRQVDGLDRSSYLIRRARNQAKVESLPARFREGDARRLAYKTDSFDIVTIMGNSFGYFDTIQDDLKVLNEVRRVLKPDGRLLIDVTDGAYVRQNYQPRSWEWIDRKHFVCRERSLSGDQNRLISREVVTHVDRGVIVDQFYAERLYSVESLEDLLREAGFSNFNVHGEISPNSVRNQDLGMMQQRLIVTSRVRKASSDRKSEPKPVARNVVVLLGDPSRPDPVRPKGIFEEADFRTIELLKRALGSLPDYNFTYLDQHSTLTQDLHRMHGRFDLALNFCDEGLNNEPRKELHVPALLEQIKVPYTGAGPHCLACCFDKSAVRGIARELGIRVPSALFINPTDDPQDIPFGYPVLVKPNYGDSSIGITRRSVAGNYEELMSAIAELRETIGFDKPILIEEFLPGAEVTVGIIGNPPDNYCILPMVEEDYSVLDPDLPRICGYEAKWIPDSPYWKLRSIPADLPEAARNAIADGCLKLFSRLECRDYARFDWRLDSEGTPKLLEVNPNPGWCWDGHLAKMAGIAGYDYSGMLTAILQAAEVRIGLSARGEIRPLEKDSNIAAGA